MIESVTQGKVTVLEAAKALNIARKTVYRWIEKGLLSKVKEGNKTFVVLEEVKAICDKAVSQGDTKFEADSVADTSLVTLERLHYEGLLIKLGQFEAERRYLLEYKTGLEAKDKELIGTKNALADAEKLIEAKNKTMQLADQKIKELEAEVERSKNRSWLKRIFFKP